jgi:hypothetical protein
MVHTNVVVSFHLLAFHLIQDTTPVIESHNFNHSPQLHGLPPSRPHDHHIPLLPNTTLVNVKPYCYPHSQKEAMTSIIHDMLREGTIIPTTSPFSSPVFLKDGTGRFCVDYRALNTVTDKDHFPIPTIDELLDELGQHLFSLR